MACSHPCELANEGDANESSGVGGLTSFEAQRLVRGLAGIDVVGGDMVEVSPPFDVAGTTALVGATILFEMLCVTAQAVARRRG